MPWRYALRLGKFGPTEIWLDATWLVLLPFLSWSLAVGYFPLNYPILSPTLDVVLGLAGAGLLLAVVLLHVLAHLWLARMLDLSPTGALVFIFGALWWPKRDRGGGESLLALAGPALSLVLAALAFWAALNVGPLSRPLEGLVGYLTIINLLLLLVHLVPGWPLDGGRVLRSTLLGVGVHETQATRVVVIVGAVAGCLLVGFGAWQLWMRSLLPGVWLVLIGAVLLLASRSRGPCRAS